MPTGLRPIRDHERTLRTPQISSFIWIQEGVTVRQREVRVFVGGQTLWRPQMLPKAMQGVGCNTDLTLIGQGGDNA